MKVNATVLAAAAMTNVAAGAALLLTPELFPVGYAPLRLHAELDPAMLPGLRQRLADIARERGIVVAGPDGSLLAAAGESAALLFAEVGTDAVRAARGEVPYLRERRPELYRRWEDSAWNA